MRDDLDLVQLVADTSSHLGEDLSPETIEAIHDSLTADPVLGAYGESEVTYLVIGNYEEEKKQTLVAVRESLNSRSPDHLAYLLEDVDPETRVWSNFYVKFKVLEARSDHVIGVFEDNDGGHELELGEVDREKVYVFKREYETKEAERAAFDAMIATLFETLDNGNRLFRWQTAGELLTLVGDRVP